MLSRRLAGEPEERRQPGFLTDGVCGISPVILDSANAEMLAFAERFRARFGHDPVWQAFAGYDSGRLAADAIRAVAREGVPVGDTRRMRAAILDYLGSLTTPAQALPGLLGPIWFDSERGCRRPSASAASTTAGSNPHPCRSSR